MGITYLVIALNLKIFRSAGDLGADSIEDDLVCNGGHEEDRDSGTESANLDYDSQRPLLVERRLFCGRRTGGFDRKTEACWTFRTWPSAQWSSPLFVNRQLCVRRPAWAKTLIDDFCCTLTHNDTDVHDKKAFSAKECKSIKKYVKLWYCVAVVVVVVIAAIVVTISIRNNYQVKVSKAPDFLVKNPGKFGRAHL